ncbi:MAG TPA: helix-turn-helix domain-containing protein [Candidatus Paenibacillus intestinavium]|nr:helix-turn-helix domain-containing protein [Candidatus Paenibacillus intestinavium]
MQNFQFSTNFAQRRKEQAVTQQQVAEYVGVSKAAVSKWEQGLSYPDITLLPKLATYFNLSIDALLGYEPQMTKEHIQKMYAKLAKRFGEQPFEQVQLEIEELLLEYYACFPFVLQMAQLYLNYYTTSANQADVLDRVLLLCDRVISLSANYKLAFEAEMIKAYVMLLTGKPKEVLRTLGDEVSIHYGKEQLIAKALGMTGQADKAKEIIQVSMYQYMLGTISSATESLLMETNNSSHFDETVHRIEVMLDVFQVASLNVNAGLVFYLKAAMGYVMQQRNEQALEMLRKYYRICCDIVFPISLCGDQYYYLLDDWIARDINLGSQAPRDELSIKKDLLSSISNQPMFDSLKNDKEFIALVANLKHHLQL